jgi:hypothetical protein
MACMMCMAVTRSEHTGGTRYATASVPSTDGAPTYRHEAFEARGTRWGDVTPSVLLVVRGEFPDAWFVGKMIYGDHVKTSGLDSVTQYELWWASWS